MTRTKAMDEPEPTCNTHAVTREGGLGYPGVSCLGADDCFDKKVKHLICDITFWGKEDSGERK